MAIYFCKRLCYPLYIGQAGQNYSLGHHYCTTCEGFILSKSNICPCCHSHMKFKASCLPKQEA